MKNKIPKRELIIDVMYKSVYKQGYHNVGINFILKESGISKGGLYHHFSSKKEIMIAVLRERLSLKMDTIFTEVNGYRYNIILSTLEEVANSSELIESNCPYNTINMELYNVDKEFKKELDIIFESLSFRVEQHLQSGIDMGMLQKNINIQSISLFILSTMWGALNIAHSKENFHLALKPLYIYLESIKK